MEKYQHSQTEITKDKAIRDFTAYQKEMCSKESDLLAIPGYKKHVKELREEVEKQDLEIADLTEELQRIKTQLEGKDLAIATLQTENQKLEGRLGDAAKNEIFLSEELQRFKYGIVPGEDKPLGEQLQLFPTEPEPTPEPEPENTESPAAHEPEIIKPESTPETESNPEEIDFTGTIPRGELVKYINENFPDLDFKGHQIGACFNINLKTGKPKSSKLSTYESDYGFKYVGMIEGEHRFRLNSKP
ncbi:MAG TPA: hypothetical protein V6D21_21830 [Candidatus Obscuribacterales bacterium]